MKLIPTAIAASGRVPMLEYLDPVCQQWPLSPAKVARETLGYGLLGVLNARCWTHVGTGAQHVSSLIQWLSVSGKAILQFLDKLERDMHRDSWRHVVSSTIRDFVLSLGHLMDLVVTVRPGLE
ncbi:hypothetical protein AFLA70_884g000111 [Aspergillus flavus AF70]|nr:hypothetical protein AFLA70_884g000111 [Aspergillus flavus AF70]